MGCPIEYVAQCLSEAQRTRDDGKFNLNATQLLAHIWARYLDREGRPDPDLPSAPEDRSSRVEPLMALYETAYLGGGDAPESRRWVLSVVTRWSIRHYRVLLSASKPLTDAW